MYNMKNKPIFVIVPVIAVLLGTILSMTAIPTHSAMAFSSSAHQARTTLVLRQASVVHQEALPVQVSEQSDFSIR